MKKQKIKTISDEIIEEIKAMPKGKRTPCQKNLLKADRNCTVLSCASVVSGVIASLGSLLLVSGLVYAMVEDNILGNKYKEEVNQYKAQQILELNEEFDGGKGFSAREYEIRIDRLKNNALEDYLQNEASPEAKAEYDQYTSNIASIAVTGTSAAFGGLGLFGAYVFLAPGEKKFEKCLEEEIDARARSKEKPL